MNQKGEKYGRKKGKQFVVIRNCKGDLTVDEFVAKVIKAYLDKESN